MTIDERLTAMRDVIQRDVNNRGLASDPGDNLLTACPGDFAAACRSIAQTKEPSVCIVTGFYIPHGEPPSCETDGPLGVIFLAQALARLHIPVLIVGDQAIDKAIDAGCDAAGLHPERSGVATAYLDDSPDGIDWLKTVVFGENDGDPWTHLIAIERVGPGHTTASLRGQRGSTPELVAQFESTVPTAEQSRCRSMRGRDVSQWTGPAHLLFEHAATLASEVATIGIGDGGNEIGMGKVPWDTIRRNIPNGGLVACRVPTDHLIVAGISNWGAYALAAGVAVLRGQPLPPDFFDIEREREILRVMVEQGPLVDGVTGKQTVSVDGLSFEEYAQPLRELAKLSGA